MPQSTYDYVLLIAALILGAVAVSFLCVELKAYKIRPGRSQSHNAIKLLELLGYGRELVGAANRRLESFEKTGRWAAAGEYDRPTGK